MSEDLTSARLLVFGVVGVLFVLLMIRSACSSDDEQAEPERRPTVEAEPEAIEPEPTPDKSAAHEAIKREPKVLDTVWEGSSLWVGVQDDGTRRDGYASYLCEVVREHNGPRVVIRVKDNSTGRELGKHECF